MRATVLHSIGGTKRSTAGIFCMESARYGLFAGDGLTIVVLDSFFSVGLVTFVSFFSHAASSASVIARKTYFFMPSYRMSPEIQPYDVTAGDSAKYTA